MVRRPSAPPAPSRPAALLLPPTLTSHLEGDDVPPASAQPAHRPAQELGRSLRRRATPQKAEQTESARAAEQWKLTRGGVERWWGKQQASAQAQLWDRGQSCKGTEE